MKNDRERACTGAKGSPGHSLLEMLLALLLLAVLAGVTLMLTASGSEAYHRIGEKRSTTAELRVALSYIQMKLRQNDAAGIVRIDSNPVNGQNAIVITEEAEDATYETWIYWDGGKLREALVREGEAFTNDLSFPVSDIDGFRIEYRNGSKTVYTEIWKESSSGPKSYTSVLSLRTDK